MRILKFGISTWALSFVLLKTLDPQTKINAGIVRKVEYNPYCKTISKSEHNLQIQLMVVFYFSCVLCQSFCDSVFYQIFHFKCRCWFRLVKQKNDSDLFSWWVYCWRHEQTFFFDSVHEDNIHMGPFFGIKSTGQMFRCQKKKWGRKKDWNLTKSSVLLPFFVCDNIDCGEEPENGWTNIF